MPSLTGWIEGILMTVLFITILTLTIGGMNTLYGKDYQTGLVTNTTEEFGRYADTSISQIDGGEVELADSESGLTLLSALGIIKTTASVIWSFITGGFITKAFGYLKFPGSVGLTFRILYLISVILIVLKVVFRRRV